MKKVVYNICFGGYGLSKKAFDWLKAHNHPAVNDALKEKKIDTQIYVLENAIKRHDLLLVQCVEELGDDANGTCAELRVTEISGDQYNIDYYDGRETVETPDIRPDMHRDWISID